MIKQYIIREIKQTIVMSGYIDYKGGRIMDQDTREFLENMMKQMNSKFESLEKAQKETNLKLTGFEKAQNETNIKLETGQKEIVKKLDGVIDEVVRLREDVTELKGDMEELKVDLKLVKITTVEQANEIQNLKLLK